MDFSIVSDTCGARVYELVCELRSILVDKINEKYTDIGVDIGFAIRCLPESYNRKSFIRYYKKDKRFVIDFCVTTEEYEKMCVAEQRFNLGNTFIEYLRKALAKHPILGLDSELFVENVLRLGREVNEVDWFSDEVDWSSDTDKIMSFLTT